VGGAVNWGERFEALLRKGVLRVELSQGGGLLKKEKSVRPRGKSLLKPGVKKEDSDILKKGYRERKHKRKNEC